MLELPRYVCGQKHKNLEAETILGGLEEAGVLRVTKTSLGFEFTDGVEQWLTVILTRQQLSLLINELRQLFNKDVEEEIQSNIENLRCQRVQLNPIQFEWDEDIAAVDEALIEFNRKNNVLVVDPAQGESFSVHSTV